MALYLVLGGSKSGKSDIAQNFAQRLSDQGRLVSVGVFGNPHIDSEFANRIAEHKAKRPETFETIEAYDDPFQIFEPSKAKVLLVDDLGSALGALADKHSARGGELDPKLLQVELRRFVDTLIKRPEITIVVSSELGLSLVPTNRAGRLFSDLMGLANQRLASRASYAYLVIAGRALDLKVLPQQIGDI